MSPFLVLVFSIGMLLGSIPFAWLLIRAFRGMDLRDSGSGNIGALNSMRVAKSRWIGVLTLLLDVLKGVTAGLLGLHLGPELGIDERWSWGAATFGVMVGHVYNPWLTIARRRLSGGKGFAALAGASLVHTPLLIVVWLAVFWITWAIIKMRRGIVDEAPSSLVAVLAVPVAAMPLYGAPESLSFALCTLVVLPRLVPEVRQVLASGEP